jgi:pimeloyl-ACP methyl ester carboxylesterase
MKLYTQWPSDSPMKGMRGDPIFDNFIKGQMQFVNDQEALTVPAGVALLDAIDTPVILLSHSQGGGMGFDVANLRPKLIAGMVAIDRRGEYGESGVRASEPEVLGPDDDAFPVRSAGQRSVGAESASRAFRTARR